ncbi:MAG TPA: hypothetical protein VLJ59_15085 [Mycobacteriales bacterium]|nr:hypothetical protein [Mycobacteriales bacterium]
MRIFCTPSLAAKFAVCWLVIGISVGFLLAGRTTATPSTAARRPAAVLTPDLAWGLTAPREVSTWSRM